MFKINKKSLVKFLSVDFLFFPPIAIIKLLPSTLLIPFLFAFTIRKGFLYIFGFSVAVLSFYLLNGFYLGFGSDLNREAVVTLSLAFLYGIYGLYFYYLNHKFNYDYCFFLKVFIVVSFFGVFLFLSNPSLFFEIKAFWSFSGNVVEVTDDITTLVRYTFLFSDPNNAAVAIVSAFAFLLYKRSFSGKGLYLFTFMVVVLVLSTMSTTGFISLFIVFSFFLFRRVSLIEFFKAIIAFALFIFPLYFFYDSYSFLFELISDRLTEDSGGSFGARLEIWMLLLQSDHLIQSFFFGSFGLPLLDGILVRPHNFVLYIYYTFGFILLVPIFYLIFMRPVYNCFSCIFYLLPLYLGLILNTGFYDFRFFVFVLFMISSSLTKQRRDS